MKETAHRTAATDGVYFVSASHLADKLLERMARGLDPWLFRRSGLNITRGAAVSHFQAKKTSD